MSEPLKSVLFVCMGNICRSPTAEAVFRKRSAAAGLSLEIDSAGTIAYHQGEAPDPRTVAAGAARGYDFSGIRARQVTDSDFDRFDLILAADRQNLKDLTQRCPAEYQHKLRLILSFGHSSNQEVPDPYYGGKAGFETVLDLLEQSSDGLIAAIREGGL
ncbi:low molecular weight phosphotyrosine protein phosphatase [Shewanella sp. JM162201]|uniref:protein-tyrosine-phosphatase n=1 Tax=Shewanella jiangmenensis TaxID=2837387 RepID=A0ABS5V600_9GAMM|nr:low molecular weight protein-tyrosine-phosphatase [Shewanella jiangmenensis]MBT1445881.1 low molecular weight phosphotyrosine protein phosphatase [Shewanella jiangmenensis]